MPSHVRPTPLSDALYEYVLQVGLREPDVLRRLREETALLPDGEWQTAPEQGPLLELLVKLIGATRVLEVGTFTGYGTLWLALSLPADGRVTTLDVTDEYLQVGKKYWREAGVDARITYIQAPAIDTLGTLPVDGFDLAFIDADKANAVAYYEHCYRLVRPGGIIAVDNTLWDGKPADDDFRDASTFAIRDLNRRLHGDARVDLCFLPFADGITILRKRG
jgi:O-methyltransferase